MSRPEGLPKTGGRQKGVPNKSTITLQETLERLRLDVPAEIARLLPELSAEKRVEALLDLMSFLHPKRKAIESLEISATVPSVENMSRAELQEFVSEAMGKLYDYDHNDPNARAERLAESIRTYEILKGNQNKL